jgi:hypothetical protein
MAGAIGWSPSDLLGATLRELLLCYQSRLLHEWDRTATLHAAIHNFMALFERANLPKGKSPAIKYQSPDDLHPFRDGKSQAKEGGITPKNFGVMKEFLRAMIRSKRQ